MTLQRRPPQTEVGVRELHDQLSRYLRSVQEDGTEVFVTMRGKRVARIVPIDHVDADPLAELRARGIVGETKGPLRIEELGDPVKPIGEGGPISDFVSELRD